MEYIEVSVSEISPDAADILIAQLSDLGFESFTAESEGQFSAYIPFEEFEIMKTANFLEDRARSLGFSYKVEKIAEQNWNEVWESAYQPVRIGPCFIRAPFHKQDPEAQMDLLIEPKMSFGTAHHETTRLMIESLLRKRFDGLTVLDMGTGTGILGIVAAKLGAKKVVAIDNDEWSYLNAMENVTRNNVPGITVIHGDAGDIPAGRYDCIFANINRNVLLRDLRVYHGFLAMQGFLLLSGFYEEDLEMIGHATAELGMKQLSLDTLNHWVAVKYEKCQE